MSDFMSFIELGGLDGQAAGVERDALADQREVGDRLGGGVGQLDQPRRRGRAHADAEDAAAADRGELLLVVDGGGDLARAASLRGRGGRLDDGVGEDRRGEVAGRGVHPVAGGGHGRGHDQRLVDDGLRVGLLGVRAEDHDLARTLGRVVAVLRLLLVRRERVAAERVALDDGPQLLRSAGRQGQRDRRSVGDRARRRTRGAAYGLGRDDPATVRLAEARRRRAAALVASPPGTRSDLARLAGRPQRGQQRTQLAAVGPGDLLAALGDGRRPSTSTPDPPPRRRIGSWPGWRCAACRSAPADSSDGAGG